MSSAYRDSLTLRTSSLVAAKGLAFAFTIAIPLLLVRRMPQHDFGLYKQIFLVLNSAVSMLPLGFGMTAFYFLPREERRRNQTVFNIVLFTSGVSALFATVLTLFPGILILLFREPGAVQFAPWIGAIVVLWVVGSFLEIVTVANHEIALASAAILAVQVSRAIFFLTAAIAAGTVRALVYAAVAQGIVQVAALWWYLSTRFPRFWRACDLSFLREQLAYSTPFGIAGLLYLLQADLHNYFVSHAFGSVAFAIYSIGCFQLPLFGILADSVGSVMIPRISALQHERKTREIVRVTARAMRKLAAVYFPAYALLFVMRREFIAALFTTRYLASVPIFAVNLTLVPLGILLLDPIMRAHAEHRHFLMKLHAGLLIALTLVLTTFIDRLGLVGAIALVVVVNAVGRVATALKVIRILDVGWRDLPLFGDVAKVAAAAAAAGLSTLVVRSAASSWPPLAAVAVCGAWFAIVYGAALLGFGVLNREEQGLLRDVIRRAAGSVAPPQAEAASLIRE